MPWSVFCVIPAAHLLLVVWQQRPTTGIDYPAGFRVGRPAGMPLSAGSSQSEALVRDLKATVSCWPSDDC